MTFILSSCVVAKPLKSWKTIIAATTATMILSITLPALAGVDYLDPIGGWRYSYQGEFNPGVTGKQFIDGWVRGPDPNVPPLSWGTGPDGFGGKPLPTTEDPNPDEILALDGTWTHNQGDKWDGTAPGDPLSNPTVSADPPVSLTGKQGTSPGGAGRFFDGDTDYIRIQDTGNPEENGWIQGLSDPLLTYPVATPQSPIPFEPINNNRRVNFGHDITQDFDPATDPIPSELVLSVTGITISFRARIPNSGPLDDIYLELKPTVNADFDEDNDVDGTDFLTWQKGYNVGTTFAEGDADLNNVVDEADLAVWQEQAGTDPNVIPWLKDAPGGHGMWMNNGRGMINVVQNDPATNLDTLVGFSLVNSTDVATFSESHSSGSLLQATSGGLIMNNLSGSGPIPPPSEIDSTKNGTLNMVDMTDNELNEWNEFWITMENNLGAIGHIRVSVYKNGSMTPQVFNVSLGGPNDATYSEEDKPYLEFGFSNNFEFGALDMDFLSYKLGVIAPTTAALANAASVPEPASLVLLALGLLVVGGSARRPLRQC